MDRNNERLPYVFLAVSNPSQDLPGVETESGAILSALEIAKAAGLIGEVIDPPRTLTLTELIRPFQNSNYRGRIAIFHYAGHGSPSQLLLEGPTSAGQLAYAGGFAQFLSTQFSLKLVFLNACSTRPQVDALLQKAGVDVVIATSQCIRDEIARMFAEEFYQALARDVTVLEAFEQAAGVVQTKFGNGYRELIRPEFLPTVGSAEPGNSASLRALVWGEETGGTTTEAKVSPWALFPREEDPASAKWKLSELKEDPTYGLPPLPKLDFPAEPYPGFRRFNRRDARAFFGRWRYIRDLYEHITSPETAPILLIFGVSGVGKSSLLEAGLVPRLERIVEPVLKRLDEQSASIFEVLRSALRATPDQSLLEAWKGREAEQKKPVVVVLDQLEEIFQGRAGGPTHAPEELSRDLANVFGNPASRPVGKLILSFTKDYLADVKKLLRDAGLEGAYEQFLQPLSRTDVIEAIRLSPQLRRQYRLQVEKGLAELIADALTKEGGLIVAPTVQILLAEMWADKSQLTESGWLLNKQLFWQVNEKGVKLPEFLKRQMEKIASWNKSVVDSGLLLDLLAAHTESGGRASECKVADLRKDYSHQGSILDGLIAQCKKTYLLVDPAALRLRLAHDTLAPLVRGLYDTSVAPGQQARRILETRAKDWQDGKSGPPLAEVDLSVVEKGRPGMRDLEPSERQLLDVSRKLRSSRRRWRRTWQGIGLAAVVAIVAVSALALRMERERADVATSLQKEQKERADEAVASQQRFKKLRLDGIPAALAGQALLQPPGSADERRLLLARQAYLFYLRTDSTAFDLVDTALRTSLAQPLISLVLRKHNGFVTQGAVFGSRLATSDTFGAVLLWDLKHPKSEPRRLNVAPTDLHRGSFRALRFTENGKNLTAVESSGDRVLSWNLETGQQTSVSLKYERLPGDNPAIALSPDGIKLALGQKPAWNSGLGVTNGRILLWESLDRPQETISLNGSAGGSSALDFSRDGARLAAGGEDGTIRIWGADPNAKLLSTWNDAGSGISALKFSYDGNHVALGNRSGEVKLLDCGVSNQRPTLLGKHDLEITYLEFSRTGERLASAGRDWVINAWPIGAGNRSPVTYWGHEGTVDFATFSEDSQMLISGGSDKTIRLWAGEHGLVAPVELPSHPGSVESIAFSPTKQ